MSKNLLLSLCSIVLVAGCGGADGGRTNNSESGSASAALDSNSSSTTEGALLYASVAGTEVAVSANEAAINAAASLKSQFSPATCVINATVSENVLSYSLKDCTGPWGLVHVSGTVVVTLDKMPGAIHATLKATNVTVNGASFNLDSDAVYTVSGSSHKLAVNTDGDGVGFFGTKLARHGSFTFSWDSDAKCADLDGEWSTTIGNDTWSTSVKGFEQCKGVCPASGTISHTGGISGVTITVSFNGSADAKWTSSNGKSGDLLLLCIGG
jgi:hypothetical protein